MFVYTRAGEKENACPCVQCNLPISKGEDILGIPNNAGRRNRRRIYGHECDMDGSEFCHLQCLEQAVTHYRGFVSGCHKNFLDTCVIVKTEKGYMRLTDVPEKY